MRRSFALVFLFVIGCGDGSKPDSDAARAFLRRLNIYAENVIVDEPEYAAIPKIPRRDAGTSAPDRAAACGVRIKFLYRDGSRTTHDDWIVWVTSDHKAIGFTGNGEGDNWCPTCSRWRRSRRPRGTTSIRTADTGHQKRPSGAVRGEESGSCGRDPLPAPFNPTRSARCGH